MRITLKHCKEVSRTFTEAINTGKLEKPYGIYMNSCRGSKWIMKGNFEDVVWKQFGSKQAMGHHVI